MLNVAGWFDVECLNPDGSLAWEEHPPNAATTVGLNYLLNTAFRGTSQSSSWYLGLIDGATAPTLASADTMSSHAGWTENTGYSQGTRPQWSPASAASGAVANSAAVAFTVNAAGSVYGVFAVDNSTKSGTTGTLYATGGFTTTRTVAVGQTLNVTYTVSCTAG